MALILITDDSPLYANAHAKILQRAGYDTLFAENGFEALIMANEHMPSVILMDVVMPVMNGFEATRRLKKNEAIKHIPLVITSTKANFTDAIWAKRKGASGYLVKPVQEELLLATVSNVIQNQESFTMSGIWQSPQFR